MSAPFECEPTVDGQHPTPVPRNKSAIVHQHYGPPVQNTFEQASKRVSQGHSICGLRKRPSASVSGFWHRKPAKATSWFEEFLFSPPPPRRRKTGRDHQHNDHLHDYDHQHFDLHHGDSADLGAAGVGRADLDPVDSGYQTHMKLPEGHWKWSRVFQSGRVYGIGQSK